MLNVAATLAGLWGLWLALTFPIGGGANLAIGAGAACAATLIAARLGAFEGRPARLRVTLAALLVQRCARALAGAMSTARSALSPGLALRPALARIRTRETSEQTRATFADYVGAAPGVAVIEAKSDGMLIHVLDEDGLETSGLAAIEARLAAALDGTQ
jgi:multisubunit Na+/H+ antiporter MnhE subunit